MVAFNKIADFVEHLAEKKHNLGSDTLTVALSNTAPGSETPTTPTSDGGGVLANVTQIVYTGLSSRVCTVSASAQTSGTYKLTISPDLVLTASGTIPAFRYVYVYNDTATNDELIGYYDYGSSVSMVNGDTFTIDFDGTNGFITIA